MALACCILNMRTVDAESRLVEQPLYPGSRCSITEATETTPLQTELAVGQTLSEPWNRRRDNIRHRMWAGMSFK